MRAAAARIAIASLAGVLLVAGAASAPAQVDVEKAAMVKTGYLYNFTKLITWPDGVVDAEYVIGVVGPHPFDRYLAKLASQRIDGRPVRVRRLGYGEDLAECHVLFLGGGDPVATAATLDAVAGRPVLTVSEQRGFAEAGGVIELFLDDDRIGIAVNLETAAAQGLQISPKILSAAEVVGDRGPARRAGRR